jgi:hypothetical protein
MHSSETFLTTYKITLDHDPEDYSHHRTIIIVSFDVLYLSSITYEWKETLSLKPVLFICMFVLVQLRTFSCSIQTCSVRCTILFTEQLCLLEPSQKCVFI